MAGASRPVLEASQVGRSAPEATPGNRLETAQEMAAHAKARAPRTLDRRNVEGQGGRGGPGRSVAVVMQPRVWQYHRDPRRGARSEYRMSELSAEQTRLAQA